MRKLIAIAAVSILAACASLGDPAQLEAAAVATYTDAAVAVAAGLMTKERGAQVLEEANRLAAQYAALALIRGGPSTSAKVEAARAQLVAALK